MLCLEIEYLMGVSFASVSRTRPEPDFPPQPDRVFSALTSSWAARGKREDERAALAWLEAQPVPSILHGEWTARGRATVYVPPNDDRIKGDKLEVIRRVLPAYRSRQAREFPAVRLNDEARCVSVIWEACEPDQDTLTRLQAIAADTSYVGHSASLTRLTFQRDAAASAQGHRVEARRTVFPGRLRQLEAAFARGQRPEAGALNFSAPPSDQVAAPHSVFSPEWLVLELLDRTDDRALDVRASSIAAKAIRDTVMSGYKRIGFGNAIPEVVSGHKTDRSPSTMPHLAIVPMAFVGRPHADGRLFGFALVAPRDVAIFKDDRFRRAVSAVSRYDEGEERRILDVQPIGGSWKVSLGFIDGAPLKLSLRHEPYCDRARHWASITPIVLDRHLKAPARSKSRGDNDALQREIEGLVADAAERIGLPRPARVNAGKHSALEGAPSARPSGNAPEWTRWQVPGAFASRTLVHATLTFDGDVEGPVLLGAGRYVGLGLCRPTHELGAAEADR